MCIYIYPYLYTNSDSMYYGDGDNRGRGDLAGNAWLGVAELRLDIEYFVCLSPQTPYYTLNELLTSSSGIISAAKIE
jgi:hypothetical protein